MILPHSAILPGLIVGAGVAKVIVLDGRVVQLALVGTPGSFAAEIWRRRAMIVAIQGVTPIMVSRFPPT